MSSPIQQANAAVESTELVDFVVVNRVGRVLHTASHLDIAKRWAKANQHLHTGVEVREVTTTVTSRRVYRPAVKLEVVR